MPEARWFGMLGSVTGKSQPGARPSAPESRVKQFTSSPYSKSPFARGALGEIPKIFTTSDGHHVRSVAQAFHRKGRGIAHLVRPLGGGSHVGGSQCVSPRPLPGPGRRSFPAPRVSFACGEVHPWLQSPAPSGPSCPSNLHRRRFQAARRRFSAELVPAEKAPTRPIGGMTPQGSRAVARGAVPARRDGTPGYRSPISPRPGWGGGVYRDSGAPHNASACDNAANPPPHPGRDADFVARPRVPFACGELQAC